MSDVRVAVGVVEIKKFDSAEVTTTTAASKRNLGIFLRDVSQLGVRCD